MSAAQLDLQLTPEVRNAFERFLSSSAITEPILCLVRSAVADDRGIYREGLGSWFYGSYGPANILAVEPALRKHGHELLYEVEGMVIAIPTPQYIHELIGNTLALREGKLVVVERENDT
jgi:hypothetical protein